MAKGFAALSPERRKEISAMGNAANHNRNKFNSVTGMLAGRIGGKAKNKNKGRGSRKKVNNETDAGNNISSDSVA